MTTASINFNGAQTFTIDPSTVGGSSSAYVSRIRLFFRGKPEYQANKSGILLPGVVVRLVPTVGGVPDLTSVQQTPSARCGYVDVLTSATADQGTDFLFSNLVRISTGVPYAILISFDGNEDFTLWTSVQGDALVQTNTSSPGSSTKAAGEWFDYVSQVPSTGGNQTGSQSGSDPTANSALSGSWRPLATTDLKFEVFVARFTFNGSANLEQALQASNSALPPSLLINSSPISVTWDSSSHCFNYEIPSLRYEYLSFDYRTSHQTDFTVGERAWPHTCLYPNDKNPARVGTVSNSTLITTIDLNFSDQFSSGESIVVLSANDSGDGLTAVNVRNVVGLNTNSALVVDRPLTFTNAAANFYKVPTATVEYVGRTKLSDGLTNVIILSGSNANSSVRFSDNRIERVSVTAGGSGYSNTDTVSLTGYEQVTGKVLSGYPASAVLTTNSTGGIVSVQMANLGSGFTNSSAITATFSNSTGGSSNGSGATLSYETGLTIASEYSFTPNVAGYAANCRMLPMPVHDILVSGDVSTPFGSFFNAYVRLPYYRVADSTVSSGYAYYCDSSVADMDQFHVTLGQLVSPQLAKHRVVLPWSMEVTCPYASGTSSNGSGGPSNTSHEAPPMTSNGAVLVINATSNCDFTAINPGPLTSVFFKYLINDTWSGEEGNQGLALSRGITRKVSLANGQSAEDVRVYLTAWRPANTDLIVYARVHNGQDPEAFDDKDWTMLEQKSGTDSLTSSPVDETDMVEIEYGFQSWPNTSITLDGVVTTTNASANVVGVNTSFTDSLASGDLVRIYDPLFPSDDYMVAVVNSVTSDTALTLATPVTSDDVLGSGKRVDKIGFPHQAFNNILSENVVRYYSSSLAVYDTFDTMQFKIVFVSDDDAIAPRVDNFRAVAISS